MKIPKRLTYMELLEIVKKINVRSVKNGEKIKGFKQIIVEVDKKINKILDKLINLEKRYCDLVLSKT